MYDPWRGTLFGTSEPEPLSLITPELEQEYLAALSSTSNRLARLVMQVAYKHLVQLQVDPYSDAILSRLGWDTARNYQHWVRRRIAHADLAQRIAGGADMFQEYCEAVPEIIRPLERLQQPRTVVQQVEHVIFHLEWYLDPTKRPPSKADMLPLIGLIFGLGSGFIFLANLFLKEYAPALAAQLTYLLSVATVFGILICAVWGGVSSGEARNSGRYVVNVVEFYKYIVHAYSDLEDGQNQAGSSSDAQP